jgi:hypothetical protein
MFLNSHRFHGLLDAFRTMLFLPHSFNVAHLDSHAQNIMPNKTNMKTKNIDTLRSMKLNKHIEDNAYQTNTLSSIRNTLKLN